MAKRTLWNWLFGLMAKPEPRQPMAVPNNPQRKEALSEGQAKALQDEWNELCSREAPAVGSARHAAILAGQRKWEPGIEHSQPHPVKENPDGSLYYKGKVYRMIGDHGRHNSKNKRRQG